MRTLLEILNAEGYRHCLRMPDGSVAGLHAQIFTTGLCVGLTNTGYTRRYCYEHEADALAALMSWNGAGDPPGPWIKEKPGDRLGPGATSGDIR